MVLLDNGFWSMTHNNWNYFSDYVIEWPENFLELLKWSGLSWDKDKKELIYNGDTSNPVGTSSTISNFINASFSDQLYNRLISAINQAYSYNIPTGVFVLSRKMIENLIIDILRKKFTTDVGKYYNTSKKRFLDFSELLETLKSNADLFGPEENAIKELLEPLKKFREIANKSTHSITQISQISELDSYKVGDIVDKLKFILRQQNKGI